MENMNIYVSDILKSYKDTIIGFLVDTDSAELLSCILKLLCVCAVYEENQALSVVMYCSDIMYKYYSHIRFLPIKHNEEVNYIHD